MYYCESKVLFLIHFILSLLNDKNFKTVFIKSLKKKNRDIIIVLLIKSEIVSVGI
jgi:hypothetical protein